MASCVPMTRLTRYLRPVVAMLRDAGLQGSRTETEAYLAISAYRYMLLRTHSWDEDVIRRIRAAMGRGERPAG